MENTPEPQAESFEASATREAHREMRLAEVQAAAEKRASGSETHMLDLVAFKVIIEDDDLTRIAGQSAEFQAMMGMLRNAGERGSHAGVDDLQLLKIILTWTAQLARTNMELTKQLTEAMKTRTLPDVLGINFQEGFGEARPSEG